MRVLGGFVATEQWVIHAAKRSHEPPAPILRLVPAYEQKIQFYVSDKVHDKMKAIISHLNNALAESIFASHVQWLMRERKSLLSSGSNKKFRQSVAVIVSHIFCLGWGCAGGPPGPTSVPCSVVGGLGPWGDPFQRRKALDNKTCQMFKQTSQGTESVPSSSCPRWRKPFGESW